MYRLYSLSEILHRLQHENSYWRIGFFGLVIAAAIHGLFIPLFLYLGIPFMAALNVLSVLTYLSAIFVFGVPTVEEKNDGLIGWMVYFEITIHNTLAAFFLSRDAGFQFYIYLLLALPFFTLTYKTPIHIFRALVVVLLSIWIESDPLFAIPKILIHTQSLHFIHIANLLIFLGILGFLSYLYSRWERDHTLRIERDLMRDPLTGLNNRRYLDVLLKEYTHTETIGLMLLDIDHFKLLNDRYGHDCGDVALISLATTLREHFYKAGVIRWGGEEFLLIYPTLDKEELIAEAEHLRSMIEQNRCICGIQILRFTVTIGATLFRPKEEGFPHAMSRADRALYRGKESGRNCVVFLDEK